MDRIVSVLNRYRFVFQDETGLQDAIEEALLRELIKFTRECRLSAKDRPDFLIDDGTVIEVKVAGDSATAMRQLTRYAKHEVVSGLILATTQMRHMPLNRSVVDGKLISVVWMNR